MATQTTSLQPVRRRAADRPLVPGGAGLWDVAVIGGGMAGLCAAIEARLSGAFAVLVLDAAPWALRGGNARHARNLRLAQDAPSPWQPDRYPVAEFAADLARLDGADRALAAMVAQGASALGPWLADQGVAFEPLAAGDLPYSRRTRFLRGGGQALVNALYARSGALGVRVVQDMPVLGVALGEPGDGVRLDLAGGGGVRAQSVVVACGGYAADRAALARSAGSEPSALANRGTPYNRGEPLTALWAAGALSAGRPGDGHWVAVDARAPCDDAGIVARAEGMALGIVVDRSGRRFADERAVTGPARYSHWGRLLAERADPEAWIVLGAEALASLPPLVYPPIVDATPSGLARRCGIAAAGLEATLASDPVAAERLGHGRGPFAALPIRPGITFTRHGLAVDDACRVRVGDGGAAEAVFAAGAAIAGAVMGQGYLSGLGLTLAGVSGRVAGRAAARRVTLAPGAKAQSADAQTAAAPFVASVAAPAVEAMPSAPGGPGRVSRMASATAATTASGVALGGGAEDDARRTLNLCNVCGFCTGLCDVFAAAQRRPDLRAADLRHLAHLCHDCRSCFYDCQYAPPHRFAIGVPAALARVRLDHYGDPRLAGGLFWGAVVAVPAAMLLLVPGARLFAVHQGAGAFYAVLPHAVMSALAATGVALAGLWLAGRLGRFWLASAGPPVHWSWRVVARGVADAVVLRNLGGGRGPGCHDRLGRTDRWRRWSHHAVVTGVALTAAATLVAAVYHAGLGRVAPYPLTSPPVWLGTLGGVFMLGGLAGLARRRRHRDQAPDHGPMARADRALRGRLAWVAASGLVLLALRDTPAMGLMLALHLGSVLGLTLTVPISKLAHGAFRTAALIREAGERAARQRAARAGQGRVSKLGRAEAGGA